MRRNTLPQRLQMMLSPRKSNSISLGFCTQKLHADAPHHTLRERQRSPRKAPTRFYFYRDTRTRLVSRETPLSFSLEAGQNDISPCCCSRKSLKSVEIIDGLAFKNKHQPIFRRQIRRKCDLSHYAFPLAGQKNPERSDKYRASFQKERLRKPRPAPIPDAFIAVHARNSFCRRKMAQFASFRVAGRFFSPPCLPPKRRRKRRWLTGKVGAILGVYRFRVIYCSILTSDGHPNLLKYPPLKFPFF